MKRCINPHLSTLLFNDVTGKPINEASWRRMVCSTIEDYKLLGRADDAGKLPRCNLGILGFRSILATALNFAGYKGDGALANEAFDYSSKNATGLSRMPIRYAANKHETSEWARAMITILVNLAVRSRSWKKDEFVLWEAIRPLITPSLKTRAEELTSEFSTLENRRPEAAPGSRGAEYIAMIRKRESLFEARGIDISEPIATVQRPPEM